MDMGDIKHAMDLYWNTTGVQATTYRLPCGEDIPIDNARAIVRLIMVTCPTIPASIGDSFDRSGRYQIGDL